jgi:hypothetical protein
MPKNTVTIRPIKITVVATGAIITIVWLHTFTAYLSTLLKQVKNATWC